MKCDLCGQKIRGESYEGVEGAPLCRHCYRMVGVQPNVEEATKQESEEDLPEFQKEMAVAGEEPKERVPASQPEPVPLHVPHGKSPAKVVCFNLLLTPILVLISAFIGNALLYIFNGLIHHDISDGDIAQGIIYFFAMTANTSLASLLAIIFSQILKGESRTYQIVTAILTTVSAACGVYVTKYASSHYDLVFVLVFALATFAVMEIAYRAVALAARPFSFMPDRVARGIVASIAVVALIAIVLSAPVRKFYDPGYPARMKEQFWTRVFQGKEVPAARRQSRQEADYVVQRLRAEKPALSSGTIQELLTLYDRKKDPSVAIALVSLPSFPPNEARLMVTMWSNPEINRAIAENDAMPIEVLEVLPDDVDDILLAKAKDERTSPEILEKLSLLQKPEIFNAVIANKNCPPDLQKRKAMSLHAAKRRQEKPSP